METEKQNKFDNWQYVGKLVNLTPFDDGEKLQTMIETDTTFLVVLGTITEPVRKETVVKISKLDKTVRIGRMSLTRV